MPWSFTQIVLSQPIYYSSIVMITLHEEHVVKNRAITYFLVGNKTLFWKNIPLSCWNFRNVNIGNNVNNVIKKGKLCP